MKTTNKILSLILAVLMIISIIPLTASAEEPTSGTCGDNLTWEFDEDKGTLIISGTGEMYRYDYYFNASNDEVDDRPWWSYTSKIKNIIINEGVTTISEKAFYDFRYLFFVTIPSSITHIEDNAFYSWDGIMAVNYLGSEEKWNNVDIGYGNADLYDSEKFYFKDDYVPVSDSGTCGDNLTWTFDANTFTLTFFGTGDMKGFSGNDTMLSEPNLFNGKRPWEDYEFAVKHVVISDGITSIGKNAFAMFINLESIEIPDSVTKIGFYSFGYCINLTDVYYSGSQDEWNSIKMGDMFGSFNTPLDIATIHYNTAASHTHEYKTSITAPTCTEQGYTTYICECGDSYVDDYVDAIGHSYTSEITISATHTTTGVMTYTCACGDTYTEVIAKLEKHNYEAVVTPPTCTEQGYTTYTCECGDSYIDNYVDELGHTEETISAVAPTCTETGLTEGAKCSVCGETLTEQKELPANGHISANAVEENYVAPTCTENGSKDVIIYCSVCDEEISRETETIEATDHADNDGNGYCDACNEQLEDNNDSQISIISLIIKIITTLLKFFGINI